MRQLFSLLLRILCFSGVKKANSASNCRTTEGKGCKLPFIAYGQSFHECVPLPDGKSWCSLNVDKDGNHLAGSENWGICGKSCPTIKARDNEQVEPGNDYSSNAGGGQQTGGADCSTTSGATGKCKPMIFCTGISLITFNKDTCLLDKRNGTTGVCCTTVNKNPNTGQIAFKPAEAQKKPNVDFSLKDIENILLNELPDVSTLMSQHQQQMLDVWPTDPSWNITDEEAADDEAEFQHLSINAPINNLSSTINNQAQELISQAAGIIEAKQLSPEEVGLGLTGFNLSNVDSIKANCPWLPAPKCDDPKVKKYRTIDGSCNNLKRTNFGRAQTPFQRILHPVYDKKSIDLPRIANDGKELPSARLVSNKLKKAPRQNESDLFNTNVFVFGQFVDHDFAHTPNSAELCCKKEKRKDKNKCFPILIPKDDPFWASRKKKCIHFARSFAAPALDCSLQYRQQMNQLTHWLDGSNIYGSSDEIYKACRGQGGQLKTEGKLPGSSKTSLPACGGSAKRSSGGKSLPSCKIIGAKSDCPECYVAGDARVNEHAGLTGFHTLWMREHNRVARALAAYNTSYDDETLFQEARRITIAEYQHIIYKEFLLIVLGHDAMSHYNLWPVIDGYGPGYKPAIDPRVTNEMATAAFRFGHSLVPEQLTRIAVEKDKVSRERNKLQSFVFSARKVANETGLMEGLLWGFLQQAGEASDAYFSKAIQDHLFEGDNVGGVDLIALNIQRGRDHGIGGYNLYREACGKRRAADFDDLKDSIPAEELEVLKSIYAHVDDIDLFVGGVMERRDPDAGGLNGPTFTCIIADGFARLKHGDRFFYDSGDDKDNRFTEAQLAEIRKTSLARIYCDNVDGIEEIQPQAFLLPCLTNNQPQPCRGSPNIPAVNLKVFAH